MSELKMTLNQIKNETKKTFDDGYDHPEEFGGCTDASGQEFQCCTCNGNADCQSNSNTGTTPCTCSCNANGNDPTTPNTNCCTMMNCPNDNLESCVVEKRWEMTEHLPPQKITDEIGTNVQYVKVIRITRHYRAN